MTPTYARGNIEQRVEARKHARELLSLAECDTPEFWEAVADEAQKRLPQKLDAPQLPDAMTDAQAKEWDWTPIPFGKHAGLRIADVPLDYLVWLSDQKDEFKDTLRRYLRSPRIQAELNAGEEN